MSVRLSVCSWSCCPSSCMYTSDEIREEKRRDGMGLDVHGDYRIVQAPAVIWSFLSSRTSSVKCFQSSCLYHIDTTRPDASHIHPISTLSATLTQDDPSQITPYRPSRTRHVITSTVVSCTARSRGVGHSYRWKFCSRCIRWIVARIRS